MVRIQYLGHSFFKISFSNINILVDPFIKCNTKDAAFDRLVECPVSEDDLKNTTMILITHEHFDHFEKDTVEKIAQRDNALVVAHDSILTELDLPRNLTRSVTVGDEITLRNINIKAVSAHHPHSFYPLGYVMECKGQTVYHAGDTALTENFADIKCDIALLPIGGTYTMDCVDAVKAVKTMKPEIAIPMHYNTFEMIKADPNEFKAKIEKSILKTKAVILQPKQTFKL